MAAHVKKLSNFKYNGHLFTTLWVILDESRSPPILSLLYTSFLSRYGVVYESKELSISDGRNRIHSLEARDISDSTIRAYVYNLSKFLNYLEECKKNHNTVGMHSSSTCSEQFVNRYLNTVLANELDSSTSLEAHCAALSAYFNWLEYMEITPKLNLRIYRTTRQLMFSKSQKQHYIQYVSRYWRLELLKSCASQCEKLMMRMGSEVGLRSSELMGLRVSGKNDLCELFRKLDNTKYDMQDQFPYRLHGKYTKGSKSRWIYFQRQLLIDMLRYYNTERKWLEKKGTSFDSSFFLRTDNRFSGTGIGPEQASRVFHKRAKEAGLNPLLHFHDLRHTFATERFHEELSGPDGRETRSESAALIVTAQLLGHSMGRDGKASPVTTRYIRMRLQMIELESNS